MNKNIHKQISLLILLIFAFCTAGIFCNLCEYIYHNILISCIIFVVSFSIIIGIGFKFYHIHFSDFG